MRAPITLTEGVPGGRGLEAARLQPPGATCATLDWPLPPADSEGPVPPDVVGALSHALAACGTVAFRYDDPLPGAQVRRPPRAPTPLDRLRDAVGLGPDRFGLVTASDPAILAAIFAYGGWPHAAQAALAYDPTQDPAPILAALAQGPDWRTRPLPKPARLLLGPGHDGTFAVIAAADAAWLETFKAGLH